MNQALLQIIAGCPDGATRDALVRNGFSESDIDRAAALCLVRVQKATLVERAGGFQVVRYWAVRR